MKNAVRSGVGLRLCDEMRQLIGRAEELGGVCYTELSTASRSPSNGVLKGLQALGRRM